MLPGERSRTLQVVDGGGSAVGGHRQQALTQHDCMIGTRAGCEQRVLPPRLPAPNEPQHVRKQLSCQRLQQAGPSCTARIEEKRPWDIATRG